MINSSCEPGGTIHMPIYRLLNHKCPHAAVNVEMIFIVQCRESDYAFEVLSDSVLALCVLHVADMI